MLNSFHSSFLQETGFHLTEIQISSKEEKMMFQKRKINIQIEKLQKKGRSKKKTISRQRKTKSKCIQINPRIIRFNILIACDVSGVNKIEFWNILI